MRVVWMLVLSVMAISEVWADLQREQIYVSLEFKSESCRAPSDLKSRVLAQYQADCARKRCSCESKSEDSVEVSDCMLPKRSDGDPYFMGALTGWGECEGEPGRGAAGRALGR